MSTAYTPQQFVEQWERTELTERASAHSHFESVCRLIGHPLPHEQDPRGETFTYEYGVQTDGGRGYADVWYKGHFAIEYKTKGKYKDLTDAYRQLQRYREALRNPPLLVVTDIAHWEIHTNWQNTQKVVYRFSNRQLLEPDKLRLLRNLFYEPERLHPERDSAQVTTAAAEAFKSIVDNMREWQAEPARIAHFLTKIVFCLFAEDIGLLPAGREGRKGIFTEIVDETRQQPERFVSNLAQLFRVMADGGELFMRDIPYFNGSLFEDVQVEKLGHDALNELDRACHLDWSSVAPAIFGTLFERAIDPKKRAQLGAHYTSPADIELVIEPVLMLPLRRAWTTTKTAADSTRAAHDKAQNKRDQQTRRDELGALRDQMLKRLREITVLDPACGSGNFLYVALQLLKDLEKEVILYPAWDMLPMPLPKVHPRQLYGIEKDPIAHALASIVVWIGYLQWYWNNGYAVGGSPVLEDLSANFQCMDAILNPTPDSPPHAWGGAGGEVKPPADGGGAGGGVKPPADGGGVKPPADGGGVKTADGEGELDSTSDSPLHEVGRGWGRGFAAVTEPDWHAVDVIVGNPPFLGDKKMRGELGDDYVEALRKLYEGRVPGGADLVTYWHEKARAQIAAGKAKRVGLLSTNSIRGGANRKVLERIKESGDLFMAWADREWVLEGAAVRVSMVGFDNGNEKEKALDGVPVKNINADLTGYVDITQAVRLLENTKAAYIGDTKKGSFDISAAKAHEMLNKTNRSGRNNSDVLFPWVNGEDITGYQRAMWIIDFGTNMPESEAALYELPYEYIRTHVKPARDQVRNNLERAKWWLHARPAPDCRAAIKNLTRYIATPTLSKYRVFTWLTNPTLPDHQLVIFAREDDYFFGVLHSKIHEVWSLRMGTSLEDRPRYTPTTTFETFPFPWQPGHEDTANAAYVAVSAAARSLHAERAAWLNPSPSPSPLRGEGSRRRRLRFPPLHAMGRGLGGGVSKRTLTNLYNALQVFRGVPTPKGKKPKIERDAGDFAPRLDTLHRTLDEAVCAAYGWSPEVLADDEDILRRLLALNRERTEG